MHRKTLVNRLAAAGCPTPRVLRTWCRLFVASRLLEEPGRTVESIALQLDFETTTGLRNALKRYTGLQASALRHAGGLTYVLARFNAACDVRRPGHHRTHTLTREWPAPTPPAPTPPAHNPPSTHRAPPNLSEREPPSHRDSAGHPSDPTPSHDPRHSTRFATVAAHILTLLTSLACVGDGAPCDTLLDTVRSAIA